MKKLHNDRGETLVEVLASILVAALSVTLLFGCIMTSSDIDVRAKGQDEEHYVALSNADAQPSPSAIGNVIIERVEPAPESDVTPAMPSIAIYGGEGMYSYKEYTPKPAGEP